VSLERKRGFSKERKRLRLGKILLNPRRKASLCSGGRDSLETLGREGEKKKTCEVIKRPSSSPSESILGPQSRYDIRKKKKKTFKSRAKAGIQKAGIFPQEGGDSVRNQFTSVLSICQKKKDAQRKRGKKKSEGKNLPGKKTVDCGRGRDNNHKRERKIVQKDQQKEERKALMGGGGEPGGHGSAEGRVLRGLLTEN